MESKSSVKTNTKTSAKKTTKTIRKKPDRQVPKITCLLHYGDNKDISEDNFYKATAGIFKDFGKIPICKDCLNKIFQNYYAETRNTRLSLYYTCRKIDIAFTNSGFEGAESEANGDWTKILGLYIKIFNSLFVQKGYNASFDESEECDFGNSKITNVDIKPLDSKLTAHDRRIKKNIIELIGRDPFEGHSEIDQKFCYSVLINYLDEDTVEDEYKVSQIIQICNNNNQINKYNFLISQYSSDPNTILGFADELKILNELITKISSTNDRIAKENGISVNNRKNNSLNKNSLTSKMKFLEEHNFDDIEADYYNQKLCKSMERVENISLKAIREQFPFDENTFNDIIITQRELIQEKDKTIAQKEEEIRELHIKLDKNYEVITEGDLDS